ncbi:MAG TPA: hypothetical protein DEQ80_06320 [Anaerolinea thermolimosa]|uniref:4-amino-4-deoxy-L-arabinose transferase n=1 Tax=Anaerolinea thermolimosa TaxID=229919 RepID=A0A0M9U2Q6_9CHLR|nr:glycosyltransferase family 39 protein [Anaerolinea thermolimosa]GAP08782.1 4-amino-4-deoxy-L-arabinose transferase [Anaerolinea thermolimosa]GAP08832.1 4-amino-4-deoxy-L-arabinose transferase [Anaerolinea thermolimosa]HCE17456.1 hypothetical protein [Anaerolinea thermolimosa]
MNPSMRLRQGLGLAGLVLLVLATRLPFRSEVLYHWDSVNFAYAMKEFNLAREQPQPPGYIVYVWLCRLVDGVFHDAQTTMVSLSILASVFAVLGMYFLGKELYNSRTGWAAALFLAASPLFWFYGEIALPHTLDAMFVIWISLGLLRVMRGERGLIFPVVIGMAIAGGVRQQTLVFLGPLALFAVRKLGLKRLAVAAALGAVLCLAWFVPLIQLSGGLQEYLRIVGAFTDRFQKTTSIFMGAGWGGVRRNAIKLILYSGYGWNILCIPVLAVLVRTLRARRLPRPGERSVFLALWVLPAGLFYLVVHMGQQGLVFVFLPALLLLSAAALDRWLCRQPPFFWAGVVLLVAISGSIFALLPEYPLGAGTQRLLTRQTLQNNDRYFLERFRAIRQSFPPESSSILATNWHHVEFYLPEYRVFHFDVGAKWEVDEGLSENQTRQLVGISDAGEKVILFDAELEPFNRTPERVAWVELSGGDQLAVLPLYNGEKLWIGVDGFGVTGR